MIAKKAAEKEADIEREKMLQETGNANLERKKAMKEVEMLQAELEKVVKEAATAYEARDTAMKETAAVKIQLEKVVKEAATAYEARDTAMEETVVMPVGKGVVDLFNVETVASQITHRAVDLVTEARETVKG